MKYSQQIKQPKNFKDDFNEYPGCHWSGQPGELVVKTHFGVRTDHVDDCIEIYSNSNVAARGHWAKLRIMPVAS